MASDYSIKKIRQDFKNKGVFYTPPELTEYMKKLIDIDFKSVYDPTCGRGNLLSCFSDEIIKYGQDIEEEAINYCQENLKNFTGYFGDTLTDDKFKNMKFDLILANPPFSIKYNLDKIDKNNDNRFKELPCLPPQSKADWAFMAHILDKISDSGMAIVLEFPGILYRKQKEGEIRKWFVDNNYIDTIISIPKGKFTDTNISTSMIILKKNKKDKKIKFIDVENEMEYIAQFQEIVNNDYDLSVNKYCIKEVEEEKIDPWELECLCRAGTLNHIKKSIELSKIVASLENWSIKEFIQDIKAILEEEQPKTAILNIDVVEVRNKQMKYYQQKLFNFGG